MASFVDRFRSAWNAFTSEEQDPIRVNPIQYSGYVGVRPDRTRMRLGNERTIISSIYTRMSIDIAAIELRHTRHDDSDRYKEDVQSGLNDCLTVEANLDQAATAFRQDIVLTLFDKGCAAIVPVDTTLDPRQSGGYDIRSMRVGEITQWYPNHIRVNLYNERKGLRQEILIEKRVAAIVENPLYSVMNEPNSTLQRLIRTLGHLDSASDFASSSKLDLIIQLPYVVKSDARRQQAEQRAKDIEFQLKNNQYGVAYTDGTEKITQLNRPATNNLLDQVEYLTKRLYVELGLTPEVMDGTADEAAMLNYNNRTIKPIVRAVTEAMKRSFLTKTARTQGQSIDAFRNPFELVPMANIAEMADKFTRNEILSSNEIRQFIGIKPSTDPKADKLINSNMPQGDTGVPISGGPANDTLVPVIPINDTTSPSPNGLDEVSHAISDAFTQFGAAPPEDNSEPAPGDLDPDVELSALDDMDKAIDDMFDGLGADNATS